MAVEVVWSGIRRRLRENEGSVVLAVKVTGVRSVAEDLMVDIERARLTANAALADPDGDELTGAFSPATPTPKDIMVALDSVEDEEDAQRWLHIFAANLEQAGRSGKVSVAPIAWPSRALQKVIGGDAGHVLTATFLGYSLEPWTPPVSQDIARWLVSQETTEQIAKDLISWQAITESGRELFTSIGTASFKLDEPFPPATLAALLRSHPQMSVLYASRSYDRYVQSGAWIYGGVAHGLFDAALNWEQHVEPAVALLTARAEHLDLGFVRLHGVPTTDWLSLASALPRFPYVDEGIWRENRLLWPRLVPDAHGVQILTPAHLDRANDLSRWDTVRLDEGHYLVRARDLEPWYAQLPPNPDVVMAARADFGAMIMSPDTIASDPQGWTPGTGLPPLP